MISCYKSIKNNKRLVQFIRAIGILARTYSHFWRQWAKFILGVLRILFGASLSRSIFMFCKFFFSFEFYVYFLRLINVNTVAPLEASVCAHILYTLGVFVLCWTNAPKHLVPHDRCRSGPLPPSPLKYESGYWNKLSTDLKILPLIDVILLFVHHVFRVEELKRQNHIGDQDKHLDRSYHTVQSYMTTFGCEKLKQTSRSNRKNVRIKLFGRIVWINVYSS